jgi:hypothetical protein
MAAMTGTEKSEKAVFSEKSRIVQTRMQLTTHGDGHVGTPGDHQLPDILQLVLPDPVESLEERLLPGHELDDLHSGQQFLQQPGSLVGPDHGLSTDHKEVLDDRGLTGRQNEEEGCVRG